jgi:hypothetical protein
MIVNNLAISLTELIERDLVIHFCDRKEVPNFFNIRTALIGTLNQYIKEFSVSQETSPQMLNQMTEEQRKSYNEHMKHKLAAMLGEAALEANVADIFDYTKENNWFKCQTSSFALIDANKVKTCAGLVRKEMIERIKNEK